MSKSLTVRELLNGGDKKFDPMDIDLSGIKVLSEALPKDGNIDLNNAEVMATKYLKGADMCAELLAIATAYAQKSDTLKKKEFGEAALVRSLKAGIKTDKSRAWYADTDEQYIEACNRYSEAIAFARWVSNKYESFIRIHYLCKKILDRGYAHEKTGNFNESTDDEKEQTW